MKSVKGKTLALMFQETSVAIAQVRVGRRQRPPHRVATFELPAPLNAENAVSLGESLRPFLRAHRLSAKTAVAGVPAKWVVGKPIQIPPTSAANLTSLISIQAEKAFSLNYDDLVLDYCARIKPKEANQVLLVAMQRQRLQDIQTLVTSAGLELLSVTPTAAATCLFSLGSTRTHCGIYAQNRHCDYVLCDEGVVRDIKHIPTCLVDSNATGLSPDLHRQLLLAGQSQESVDPLEVLLWPEQGACGDSLDLLRRVVDADSRVRQGREALAEAGHVCSDELEPAYDATIGLALAQTELDLPRIDFLNSRMAVKPKSSHLRAIFWSLFLGILVIGGAGWLYWTYHQDKLVVGTLQQQLQDNEGAHAQALSMKERIAQASPWYGGRPVYLDCLRALTLAFPERGDIWVRTLSLDAEGVGVVTGDAVDRTSVNRVADQLMQSAAFTQVEILHMTSVGDNSRNVTYAIRFQYSS